MGASGGDGGGDGLVFGGDDEARWVAAHGVADVVEEWIAIRVWSKALADPVVVGEMGDGPLVEVVDAFVESVALIVRTWQARFNLVPASLVIDAIATLTILGDAGLFAHLSRVGHWISTHILGADWLSPAHPLAVRTRIHALGGDVMAAALRGEYTDALVKWTQLEEEEASIREMLAFERGDDADDDWVPPPAMFVMDAILLIKHQFASALNVNVLNPGSPSLGTDGEALVLLTSAVLESIDHPGVAARYGAFRASLDGMAALGAAFEGIEGLALRSSAASGVEDPGLAGLGSALQAWTGLAVQHPDTLVAQHDLEYVYKHLIFSFIRRRHFLSADVLLQATLDRISSDLAQGNHVDRARFATPTLSRSSARLVTASGIRNATSIDSAFAAFRLIHDNISVLVGSSSHPLVGSALQALADESIALSSSAKPPSVSISVQWVCSRCFTVSSTPGVSGGGDDLPICSSCSPQQ